MDDEEIPLDEIISWFEEDMDDDEDDYPYDLDDDEDDDIGHYDDDELEDSDFSEHSTSESPWVFNVPVSYTHLDVYKRQVRNGIRL